MADTPLGEVILKDVRLSFADLFKPGKPQKNDKGETVPGKYKANFLMKKGTDGTKENMAKIKAAADQVKADKWGKPEKWPKLKPDRVFLRDGDLENWDGYEGCYYVSANNPDQPVLVDKVKDEKGKLLELTIANGGPKKLYSGARVNAIIRIWAQDSAEYGKRMNCSVESVQFYKHDEPFSGHKPVDPNSKFDDIEDDDDDENEIGGGRETEDSGLI
jgi:hypothetical protein